MLAAACPGCFLALLTNYSTAHGCLLNGLNEYLGPNYTPGGIMHCMKIVIIGGVAGGMSAATRLRRLSESAEITVVERTGYVSFANCGLPYYVGNVITDRSALLEQSPENLRNRFNIYVRVRHEATQIDRSEEVVRGIVHGRGTDHGSGKIGR